MEDIEILKHRENGKFVIKASKIKIVGSPFRLPFPTTERVSTFAVLDSFQPSDLPQLKKFAAERLDCEESLVEIEALEPIFC